MAYLQVLSPTIDFKVGDIIQIPYKVAESYDAVTTLTEDNVELSREDWDSFETSWDFKKHPLV
jgi:hypothetical protein